MSDFIHRWRRKVGCLVLTVAAMFTAAWVRSYTVENEITVCGAELRSCNGAIERSKVMFTDISSLGVDVVRHVYWRIPYTVIATPLTILSAYLLLGPGKRKPVSEKLPTQ